MSEATPTTDQVRRLYAYTRAGDRIHRTDEYFAQFDRWLDRVRAEERERCRKAVERSDADRTSGALRGKLAALAAIRAVSEQEDHRGRAGD